MAEKFILEFDRSQIEFIAALTHFYLSRHEDSVALSTLGELINQTNFVFSDPLKHGISKSAFTPMNRTSATMAGQNVSQLLSDLADISGIMPYNITGD